MKSKTKKVKNSRPELSIGIIFKDNIRSLERCLQALAPLREKILCQLVMADTGSTDGSRAVAEKYADVLFDFPWIDDFSAARNAVMDRCTGRWYIGVDSDEYLDENFSELQLFLCSGQSRQENMKVASVVIRNYSSYEMDGPYSDFYAVRMIRMSTGFRYQGAIHEKLICGDTPLLVLRNTVFHHDGYVGLNSEAGAEKRKRNISALREKLETGEDLLTLLQFVESGTGEEDFEEKLRLAVKKVREQAEHYQTFGPPILRHAVVFANNLNLPEREEWTALAKEMFPDSYYTRIDVGYISALAAFNRGDFSQCIQAGERCLEAYADYRAGRGDVLGQLYSTLTFPSVQAEHEIRILTASSYLSELKPEQALAHIEKLAFDHLTEEQTRNLVRLIRQTYSLSSLDTAQLALDAWEGICAPQPSQKRADERKAAFLQEAGNAFQSDVWLEEEKREGFVRYSCGAFSPLAGQCEAGTAAAILATTDQERISALLGQVKVWRQLPGAALFHALKQGVQFPPQGVTLHLEQMDGMAKRLAGNETGLLELIRSAGAPTEFASLCWQRAMVFAAMRIHEWKGGENDLPLARAFAEVERAFLPVCYAETALREENLFLLPPTHRFGWYCDKAFAALDSGDGAGYVRYLHGGLSTYEDMRGMVEVLLADFQRQERLRSASPELLALAEQVRTMLAAYPPDDPAVAALKQSEAYRKVEQLVESDCALKANPESNIKESPRKANEHNSKSGDLLANPHVVTECDHKFSTMIGQLKSNSLEKLLADAANWANKWIDEDYEYYGLLLKWYRSWYGVNTFGQDNGFINYFGGIFQYLKQNADRLVSLYEQLADYRSKVTLTTMLQHWLTFHPDLRQTGRECQFEHYFDLDVIKCHVGEVFVDCGCFDGNTVKDFIRCYGTQYKSIYSYELTPSSYEKAKGNLKNVPRLNLRNAGVSDKNGQFPFWDSGSNGISAANRLSANGNAIAKVVRIDDDIQEDITFLKMDIEGAECEALRGAEYQIRRNKPKLAISLYHRISDLLEIPQMVRTYVPTYKLYLRHNIENGVNDFPFPTEYVLLAVSEENTNK